MEHPPLITYKSNNAPLPKLTWICCYYGSARGEALPLNFTGETEQQAKEAAIAWWNTRQSIRPIEGWFGSKDSTLETQDENVEEHKSLKGQVFVGTVWVCHSTLPSKRIQSSELQEHLDQGYLQGKKFSIAFAKSKEIA